MAGYRDEIYDAIDEQFRTMDGVRRFDDNPLSDPTPYEQDSPGVIQPVGWVQNADGTDGTAKVTIDSSGIEVLDGKITVKKSGGATTISGGVVQSGGVAGGVITSTEIANNAVTTPKLIANAVTATKIATDAVEADKIKADAVTAGKIAADAVTAAKIQAGAVTSSKIAANSVLVGHLAGPPVNLIDNGGFELDGNTADADPLTGWEDNTGGPIQTGVQTTPVNHSGSYSLQLINEGVASKEYIPVTPNARYKFRAWTRGDTGNTGIAQVQLRIHWYDVDKTQISTTAWASPNEGTNGSFTERTSLQVAPSTAVYAKVRAQASSSNDTGDINYVDDYEMHRADYDVNHASGNVTINSSGVTVTNGKITVTNAGATVIIDGSSNMFKILTTGTLANPTSGTRSDNTSGVTTTTLTGLGTFASTPAQLSGIGFTTGSGDARYLGQSVSLTGKWVAGSSGGAVTSRGMVCVVNADFYTTLNGSSQCVANLWHERWGSGGAEAAYARYYILKESAI